MRACKCDRCGEYFLPKKEEYNPLKDAVDFFTGKKHITYCVKKFVDGETYTLDLCPSCYDKVVELFERRDEE